MKKFFTVLVCIPFFVGCSSEQNEAETQSEAQTKTSETTTNENTTTEPTTEGNQELHNITDEFLAAMDPSHENHGNTGNKHAKTTESGYSVTVYGKLINVKILDGGSDDQYAALKDELAAYYSNNEGVKEVSINAGGTVIINCNN